MLHHETRGDQDPYVKETSSLIASDKVEGTRVFGSDGKRIGSVERVILEKRSGKVAYAVLSFGGFLGIGEKSVAMSRESVQVMADTNGAMAIYSPFTKAQLESQAAYDEEAYKANPRDIILSNPN